WRAGEEQQRHQRQNRAERPYGWGLASRGSGRLHAAGSFLIFAFRALSFGVCFSRLWGRADGRSLRARGLPARSLPKGMPVARAGQRLGLDDQVIQAVRGRVAEDVGRLAPLLHVLDRSQQHLPRHDDGAVRRAQVLGGAVLNPALALRRVGVLRLEVVVADAGEAAGALLLAVLA